TAGDERGEGRARRIHKPEPPPYESPGEAKGHDATHDRDGNGQSIPDHSDHRTSWFTCVSIRNDQSGSFLSGTRAPFLPFKHHTSPYEPRAKSGESDQVAGGEPAGPGALVERDGDRRSGRIAVALDVVVGLVVGQTQLLLHRFRNPQIGLMGDEQGEVFDA